MIMQNYKIKNMKERLDKIISSVTSYSRKDVKKLIRDGAVTVSGVKASSPELKCDPEDTEICVKGEVLVYEKHLYLMLHKPAGVVTAVKDDRDRTVMDLLPPDLRRKDLFPVGRLDKDTEGLLLITDDGELGHRLLSPGRHVDKEYFVAVEGSLGEKEQEAFAQGIVLADKSRCMEAKLEILKRTCEEGTARTDALVTIREGMYHQIKRMFGVLGFPVLYLKRIRMGSLMLDPSLARGTVRKLTPQEIRDLRSLVFAEERAERSGKD